MDTDDCFAPGTLIKTDKGDVPIETIKNGDLIYIHNGQFQPAKVYSWNISITDETNTPYIIKQNGISPGIPTQDTIVSPRHAIYIKDGMFTFTPALANQTYNVYQLPIGEPHVYYTIELPDYANSLMFANGMPVEPYAGRKLNQTHLVGYHSTDDYLYKRYIIDRSLLKKKST